MASNDIILFCNCSWYDVVPEKVRSEVLQAITDAGIDFCAVPDLCELAAKKDNRLAEWASAEKLTIAACFPRTIKWLFHSAGFSLKSEPVVLNMRNLSADEIVAALLSDAKPSTCKQPISVEKQGDWTPWFPVIDYDRCSNCKQCLNFCLFGVYQLADDGKIQVAKPANCKTNCPACARVCPQLAIMFPKYNQSPINGDEVKDEDIKNTAATLSGMGDKDIYQMLRQRTAKKKRFAADANPMPNPSIKDLTEKLDIPPEVLASLSADEIAGIKNNAKASDCPNSEFCDNDCKKDQESN